MDIRSACPSGNGYIAAEWDRNRRERRLALPSCRKTKDLFICSCDLLMHDPADKSTFGLMAGNEYAVIAIARTIGWSCESGLLRVSRRALA